MEGLKMGATLEREAPFFGQGRVRALLWLFGQTERMLHYHGGKSRDSTHGRGKLTCIYTSAKYVYDNLMVSYANGISLKALYAIQIRKTLVLLRWVISSLWFIASSNTL
ncbi:hypothetical protein T11_12669 [Trichinella zimbabwensis]|uniref:Uncharacterized protein n=1 Tax=Trichinella zimbabwensis TaxID=268475 RepID=A0A0V1H5G0_9BILA|nr:hypothetical protein T11_12669 [Trichinella zimbabwensis]